MDTVEQNVFKSSGADEQDLNLKRPAFGMMQKTEKEAENKDSIFAEGLPGWNLEPPQLVVRRRH